MEESSFLAKVFLWMAIGLMVTFGVGVLVASNAHALETVFSSGLMWLIVIAELVTVIVFSSRIQKMSPTGAKIGFIFYSALSGLTFSSIFVAYKISSIMAIFLVTGLIMLIFSILGTRINLDLSKIGTYLLIILIGVIILSIINIFVNSEGFNLALTILSLIVFVVFIAYDIQRIKRLCETGYDNENMAIYGAFELYLDFINIFIELLRLFGNSRD